MNPQAKNILEQNNFKCQKCGYYSPLGENLEVVKEFNSVLCTVCHVFAPEEKEKFYNYLDEKINWQNIEPFRKFGINKASHSAHKHGMILGAKQGKLMARPPFGYLVQEGKLIPDEENKENVRLIFKEFSAGKSMNQISKQYGISVNGIKKILRNFSYLGKIKFAGHIIQGSHTSLISSELFNEVQRKFEKK